MKISQAIKMALSSILNNKLRSFLTMLGIIIGVMSVVLLVSIVQGATGSITESLNSLGGNLLTGMISNNKAKLNTGNLNDIAELETVDAVTPYVSGNGTAKAAGNSTDVTITGITFDYTNFKELKLQSGRKILDIDNEYRLSNCIISYEAAIDLYGTTNVLGNEINISGKDYNIVGVAEKEESTFGDSQSSNVYLSFNNARRLLKATGITNFYVTANDPKNLDATQIELEDYLLEVTGSDDYYTVTNMSSIQDSVNSIMNTLSIMLAGIAGISLVVGGIGIMNIMLVSVSERTREIGIRKAIGAKKKDIIFQFLIESITLSGVGGIIAIILCALILSLISSIFTSYDFSMSLMVVGIALGFSVGIGLIFGIYPANKASKLSPIEALRSE
jgi:putative ABC transport system permease protein